MAQVKPKVLFLVTKDWYFLSHRRSLALFLQANGYEVLVVTDKGEKEKEIVDLGFTFLPVPFSRRNGGILNEIFTLLGIIRILRTHRPNILHNIALKPILYGSIASRFVPRLLTINTVAGLGSIFVDNDFKSRVKQSLFARTLQFFSRRNLSLTIFQNPEDRQLFIDRGYIKAEQTVIIRGSGVDTDLYKPQSGVSPSPKVVALASRMLWYKGVKEFVDAGAILRKKKINAKFILIGPLDFDNKSAISEAQIRQWENEGVIEWLGYQADVASYLKQTAVFALPSYYREGVPKVLLEAASSGCAIVASDMPGCREVVQDGVNGRLVPIKNSAALAEAIEFLLADESRLSEMGKKSRQLVCDEFSNAVVNNKYLATYKQMMAHIH